VLTVGQVLPGPQEVRVATGEQVLPVHRKYGCYRWKQGVAGPKGSTGATGSTGAPVLMVHRINRRATGADRC